MAPDDVDFKMLIFLCSLIFMLVFIVRIYWVLIRRKNLKKQKVERLVKTMIVMGSGQRELHKNLKYSINYIIYNL